ncbi:cupin domain-containing protein [Geochorda subterranea]|uniref:Cupin domain-containing protein n=1 Tax=Geochorda subterranea TaxID=3109564 RepID=A0ABZ1BRC7_9FIRM|nr:cupin domain-containing protein [Limnochorda sp. LNt]WRP15016.1 cupin domain-containing protein [Limnochorda sp. LNt]
MPFYDLTKMAHVAIGPQQSAARGAVVQGQNLEVALVRYEAHRAAKSHRDSNEQMIFVLEGRLRARIEYEVAVADPGDIIHIPANVEYELVAIEDAEVISFKSHAAGRGSPRE